MFPKERELMVHSLKRISLVEIPLKIHQEKVKKANRTLMVQPSKTRVAYRGKPPRRRRTRRRSELLFLINQRLSN
jgi:hypothetical protein